MNVSCYRAQRLLVQKAGEAGKWSGEYSGAWTRSVGIVEQLILQRSGKTVSMPTDISEPRDCFSSVCMQSVSLFAPHSPTSRRR